MKKIFKFFSAPLISIYLFQFSITSHALDATLLPSTLVAGGGVFEKNMPSKYLLSSSNDGGNTWKIGTTINFPSDINFVRQVSCAGSGFNSICVATVESLKGGMLEYNALVVSRDGGNSWEKIDASIRNKARFSQVSCTGTLYPLCVASGWYTFHGQEHPFLLVSHDRAYTWEEKTEYLSDISGALSCTGENDGALCVVAPGYGYLGTYEPVFTVSIDGGKTWGTRTMSNFSEEKISIQNVSCSDTESNTICIAAGKITSEEGKNDGPPLLAVSSDNGETWKIKIIKNPPKKGQFISSSCTKSQTSSTCVAVGSDTTGGGGNYVPIVAVSKDSGNTWEYKNINELASTKADVTSLSCSGTGENTFCVAVGRISLPSGYRPLIIASSDGGNTWYLKSLSTLSANGSFEAVRCLGEGENAICTAVGSSYTPGGNPQPFLAISHDGGNTWEQKSISNLPADASGNFLGVDGGF